MKRLIAILFSVFYLAITLGLAINVHYCHGQIVSVQFAIDQKTCCCNNSNKASDCCHNDAKIVQLDNAPTLVNDHQFRFEQPTIEILFSSFEIEPDLEENDNSYILPNHSPPPRPPAWLVNCSLVFYG